MKDKFNNIIKILKDNSKIVVPSMVVLVLLIVSFITLYYYIYNSYHKEDELTFYEYFTPVKEEFTGIISRNRKKEIISLEVDDDITIGSTPIYNDKEKIIIFPKKMNIVYATNELKQNRTNDYAYLYYDNNNYKLRDKKYNNSIKHTFLYDGNNVYFFLDETILKIGEEEIKLSPMSFVVANYRNNINYYDKDSDTFISRDYTSGDVEVSNKYYKVNVMEDKLDYYGNNVLLITELDHLKYIGEE